MVATMATASVLASIEPSRAAYCQRQPELWSWKMYSMTGIIKAQLLPTTKKASTTTGVATCSQEAKAGPTAGEPEDML